MKQIYNCTTSFLKRATLAASFMCLLAVTQTSAAPLWRTHHNGYGVPQTPAPGAYASAVVGMKNGMVVSNINNVASGPYTLGTGNSIFYVKDTTNAFVASTSNFTAGTVSENIKAFALSSSTGAIYAATGNGVYKSTDTGMTWAITGSGAGPSAFGFDNVSVDNATGKIYIIEHVGQAVDVSTNGGALFNTDATLGNPSGLFFYNGYVYENMPGNTGIKVSPTSTISFTTPTLPAGIATAQFSGFTAYMGKVYGVSTNGVYSTSDNGNTWTLVFNHPSSTCIKGTDSVLVVGTSDSGIFVSINGTAFKQFSTGLTTGSGYSVTHLDTNSQYIIATTLNGAGSTLFADGQIYVMTLHGPVNNSLYGGAKALLGVQNVAYTTPTISLYPNPATSHVVIEADGITSEHVTVTVCDMIGRTVLSNTFNNSNNMQLDVSQISGGLYIVHVNDGTSTVSEKLVLSK